MKPYATSMLHVLLSKANDSNPTVAANVLMCLGELACVGGEDVLPIVPELMEVIMAKLVDELGRVVDDPKELPPSAVLEALPYLIRRPTPPPSKSQRL